MIAYKVVRVEDKPWWKFWRRAKLFSAFAEGKAQVEYAVGEWTLTPPWLAVQGYYLTAFAQGCTAKMYEYQWGPSSLWPTKYQTWTCEVLLPKVDTSILPPMASPIYLSQGYLRSTPDDWPTKTIMVDRIKLLKLLKRVA